MSADMNRKAGLPGNPHYQRYAEFEAKIVEDAANLSPELLARMQNVQNSEALLAVAFELRSRTLMEARRMNAYGITEEEVGARLGMGREA